MSAERWDSPIQHGGDADFRAWSSELSAKIQLNGLIKTSDTGQINFSTATRPSVGQVAGYEIYRLADSFSGSRPVYIKFEYGTGTNVGFPQVYVTVGNSSNGAGVLTGYTSSRFTCMTGATISSGLSNLSSYIAVGDGYLSLAFKLGASGAFVKGLGFLNISRFVNDDGTFNSDGVNISHFQVGSTAQIRFEILNYVIANTYSYLDGSNCIIYGGVSSSLVGTDVQVYQHFATTPRVRPVATMVQSLDAEVAANTTFSFAPIGSLQRNFICLGTNTRYSSINQQISSSICMIFE